MPLAQVKQVVWNKVGLQDSLTQLIAHVAAVGPFDLATVHLYKFAGGVTPLTDETTLAEVQVADWAEYLAIATTGWGATETRLDGSVLKVATPLLSWTGPAAGSGPIVNGAYIKSPLAGAHLLAVMPFVAPVPMLDATQVLDLMLPLLLLGGPFVV